MSIDQLCLAQEEWALRMLCSSEVLSECEHHEGVYVENGEDVRKAYKYAMAEFKKNKDDSPFEEVSEMTDAIKSAYEEHGGNDDCPLCYGSGKD